MISELQDQVLSLARQEYFPFAQLNDLLSVFLKAILKRAGAHEGSIRLEGFTKRKPEDSGRLVFVDHIEETPHRDKFHENGPNHEAQIIASESYAKTQTPQWQEPYREHLSSDVCSLPICYQNQTIGDLVTKGPQSKIFPKQQSFLNLCSLELAYYIKRYEIRELTNKHLGKNMMLVGSSPPMREIDRFIEQASGANLPVILAGEFGTDKSQVACAIHFNSDHSIQPFVEVNCRALSSKNFDSVMQHSIASVQGGSLYFNGIDELELSLQNQLPRYLDSVTGQWLGDGSSKSSARLLASATRDLNHLSEKGRFSRSLLAELNFLYLHLPSLRDRSEDIPNLLNYFMNKYRRKERQRMSAETVETLCNYPWPENAFELERVIARLTTMTEQDEIGMDALHRHTPNLAQFKCQLALDCADGGEDDAPDEVSAEEALTLLAASILDEDFAGLHTFHLGVQRALRYLGKSFQEEVTLSQLAEEAYISASHLSFLFKSEVGVPFKTFLAALRIESAKRHFDASPEAKITDVALESGFGDLSHFEKTFKRVTGCSPKQYRESSRNTP